MLLIKTYKNHIGYTINRSTLSRLQQKSLLTSMAQEQMNEGIDIYGPEYEACMEHAAEFEASEVGEHYRDLLCLKQTSNTQPARESTLRTHYDKIEPHITNTYEEVQSHHQKHLCVLPNGHSGACSCTMELFKPNPTTKKIKGKINQSICSTPGDNDHVYKNRDSRLHPIAISNTDEINIRNSWEGGVRSNTLKCAIPLKEKSTPFMIATAYFDYMVYTCNICGMDEHIDIESNHYEMCNAMLASHKDHLVNYFNTYNRRIFDSDGDTICAVLGNKLTVDDMADPNRNNRTDIRPTDIQMGHITSRRENCFTVHGRNIVMMSRDGNLMIGEHSFIDNAWLEKFQALITYHSS